MRKLTLIAVLACFAALVSVEAFAWEFKMHGENVWRYQFRWRTGHNDIFGRVDNISNLGVNHLNTQPTPSTENNGDNQPGVVAGEPNFGCDMGLTDYRATLYPTIKVNKAIQLKGSINLTSLGIHEAGRPLGTADTAGMYNSLWVPISDRMAGANVPNTYVTVQWWQFKIKTPMVNFSAGMKTSGAGIGLWKNKLDRASTSFGVGANYGPIGVTISPYFGRRASNWNEFQAYQNNADAPWRRDGDRDYITGLTWSLKYKCGPMEVNFFQDGWKANNAAAGKYVGRTAAGAPGALVVYNPNNDNSRPMPDNWVIDTSIGLKYFNGRFFFNGELTHFYEVNSGRGSVSAVGNAFRDTEQVDQNAWIYGTLFGTVVGPSKVTLSYIRATGDDPSTRKTDENASDGDAGVSPYTMLPWGYLMYYVYGTGTSYNQAGEGQPTDFHHVGGRIDYAVAANLNVFGVYSYAWRDQPNNWRIAGDGRSALHDFDNTDIWNIQNAGNNPGAIAAGFLGAVPESASEIGWEVDAGFDWRLLENLNWRATFAYWKPGSWWAYAYPNTANLYNVTGLGAAPVVNYTATSVGLGRDIDPLFGMKTELAITF